MNFSILNILNKFLSTASSTILATVLTTVCLMISACSKNEKPPDPQSHSELISYHQFQASQNLEVSETCNQKCTDRKKEFRYVAYVGKTIYCYWDLKQNLFKVNFEDQAPSFENRITNTTSEFQYFMLLMEWAALFHDGHVSVILDKNSQEIDYYSPPLELALLNPGRASEVLIVSKVEPEIKIFKVGTKVTFINGIPWKDVLQKTLDVAPGSTEAMRRRQAARLIFRKLLLTHGATSVVIDGIYKDKETGLEKEVNESVLRKVTLNADLKSRKSNVEEEDESSGKENLDVAVLPGNIGYLKINAFSGLKMKALLEQAMDRLSQTSGLMLDLRKNRGGDLSGNVILQRLLPKESLRYFRKSIKSDFLLSQRPDMIVDFQFGDELFSDFSEVKVFEGVKKDKGIKAYEKPVSLLISSNCFSACDTFATSFKEYKLGPVIGEPSGGGTGTPLVIELPVSKHSIRYSVWQGYGPVTKALIEGRPTDPDVLIDQTVDETRDNEDQQFKMAFEYFSNLVHPFNTLPIPEVPEPILQQPTPKIKLNTDLDFDQEIRTMGETL